MLSQTAQVVDGALPGGDVGHVRVWLVEVG
jgi:hypothetical protein